MSADRPADTAYFRRIADHRFQPLPPCTGAWNTAELHVSPVNGLLVHELERWLDERSAAPLPMTRISLDYLGVIDFGELETSFEVLRGGRSVELVEGVISQHGRPVIRARVWRIVSGDTGAVAGGLREPLAAPDTAPPHDMTVEWPGDYIEGLDVRALAGPEEGSATMWMTTPLAIVEGEALTDLARFVLLVDTANGIAVRRSPREWQFPNLDLTIHLVRQPTGRWLGLDTRVAFGPEGHGLTSSDLFDEHGHVGHAEQGLIVRPF